MEIIKVNKIGNVFVPAIKMIPSDYKGIALIIHGYGGCKEEILGLSYSIAEAGFLTYTIDLRGHGENETLFDGGVFTDIIKISEFIKEDGKKNIIIGHSLGGRLALISSSDYCIGISPALNTEYSKQTQDYINNLRSYRVNEKHPGDNFEVLRNFPECSAKIENTKIILGSRDVPDIMSACNMMKESGYDVAIIDKALHGDIFLNNKTLRIIKDTLNKWYS